MRRKLWVRKKHKAFHWKDWCVPEAIGLNSARDISLLNSKLTDQIFLGRPSSWEAHHEMPLSDAYYSLHNFGERKPGLCCSQAYFKELNPISFCRDSLSGRENAILTSWLCLQTFASLRSQVNAALPQVQVEQKAVLLTVLTVLLLLCNSFCAFHKILVWSTDEYTI